MYYLYLKTHTSTGMKYLGFTSKDPYTYLGSGKYWLDHLSKHGKSVATKIIVESEDKTIIEKEGRRLSKLWDIVKSRDFANLTDEEGTGGATWSGRKHSPKSIQKMRLAKIGKKFTDTHKKNLARAKKDSFGKQNNFYGKHHSEESKQRMSASLTGKVRSEEFKQHLSKLNLGKPKPIIECPYCNKKGGLPQMKRYHFNNCKRR